MPRGDYCYFELVPPSAYAEHVARLYKLYYAPTERVPTHAYNLEANVLLTAWETMMKDKLGGAHG